MLWESGGVLLVEIPDAGEGEGIASTAMLGCADTNNVEAKTRGR